MIFVTGDTHGDFNRIFEFCRTTPKLSREDVIIVLGDAGINYFGDERDVQRKEWLSGLPITLFCIHGNHEMRPSKIANYQQTLWNRGIVYIEKDFPNILFAKDGEIFDLGGKNTIVIGGAYSVDKEYRLAWGYRWFEDEQPSEEIKKDVEDQLARANWSIDTVLSHTCPIQYEPTEVFISGVSQDAVDKSTEEWLGKIEERLNYNHWYCGHYHTDKALDKINFLFEDIVSFSSNEN